MVESKNGKTPRQLLFVCVENSCRSQVAEAFARAHGGESVIAHSAGSAPSGTVNPKASASMERREFDLSRHHSKGLTDLPGLEFDVIVSMGCGDRCAGVQGKRRLEWDIPDPKHMDNVAFDSVRDLIESRVVNLLAELD